MPEWMTIWTPRGAHLRTHKTIWALPNKSRFPFSPTINGEYQALHAQLMGALDSLDVKKMEVLGTEFDYNMHMAIQQVPSDEYDEGLVCSELQPGYTCSDKLLRAAYVMVSAGS